MKFDSAGQVLNEVNNYLINQQTTMRNRTLVNKLFNGEAPLTDEERRQENVKSNVNFLEATRVASNATNQVDNSFFKGDRFFSVVLDKGPIQKRSWYSSCITKYINKELKRSHVYKAARRSAHAQVVLHGPGPLVWRNRRIVIPSEAGVDDVLLPSGTLCSMDNLDRFAIYRELTWAQLSDQADGPVVDSGWNRSFVQALLKSMFVKGAQPIYQGNRWRFPEKLAEDYKEGAAFAAASSLPKIAAYDFFYRQEHNDKWCRKMVLDYGTLSPDKFPDSHPIQKDHDFLYQRDDYADSWQEIIHWYIGNCSNVAPYRYYSVRSIGYLLYGACMILNKLRNRTFDHMFQQLLTLFRNVSDDQRERLGMIDLQNFGVMPDGVSMVPANERHVVDWNLIMMGFNQGRQLVSESAQGFLPEIMGDQDKEMTAQEFIGRMNMSISMTSAVMNQLGDQSRQEYREICRRFCIKDNPDPMAKRFRENLRKAEVPLDMLDVEAWEIVPEQVAGGGNKAAELNITQAAMQELFPLTDPDGQRLLARKRAIALLDNADEAMILFPEGPKPVSDDAQYAQVAFAVLMLGQPFAKKEGINHVVYANMLLQMMSLALQQVGAAAQQENGLPIAADKIMGLFNVAQHIQEEINAIARDERKLDMAKQMFKALTELTTMLQNVAKELMAKSEQQAQQGGISPEVQAKIQERLILAQNQAQIDAQKAAGKEERADVKFHSENMRRNAMTAADAQRKMILTQAEVAAKDITTAADIVRPEPKPAGKE